MKLWWIVGVLCWTLSSEAATSLRFFGNGVNDIDRVKIRIDEDSTSLGGPPADIGATDFTLEFWMKAAAADNGAASIVCGANHDWIVGNIIVDRDRYNQFRKWGISIAGGVFVFGMTGEAGDERTICGSTNVLNNTWRHIAVQRRRSDGRMDLYIGGILEAQNDGPDGDVSYPDDGVPGSFCGPGGNQPCTNSDPFLVLAAEKHDAGAQYPSYSGFMDELRLSNSLRYSANFTPPSAAYTTDGNTVALYHFDEGTGTSIGDSSGAAGGPSPGVMNVGGTPTGPIWSSDIPFTGDTLAPAAPQNLRVVHP